MHLATARAYRWKEDLQAFYDQDPAEAEGHLRRRCAGAKRSRLASIKAFVTPVESHWEVESHWDGIISWHTSRIRNALLKCTNALIQAAKARARGYRSKTKMITIIHLIAARLPVSSPYATHTI